MRESIPPTAARPLAGRGRSTNAALFFAVSLPLAAAVSLLSYGVSEFAAVGAGAVFFGLAVSLVMGDALRLAVYFFFMAQFAGSYFFQTSFAATIVSLALLPVALMLSPKTDESYETISIPNVKPFLLLLSGGAVSFAYRCLANGGDYGHFLIYDIYFLSGLAVVYELYFLFKKKFIDPEKVVSCVAVSGLLIVFIIIARHVLKGTPEMIFSERFGMYTSMNPNILTSYLDMSLSCAFFTAFFEKRNRLKQMFFYALSLAYICVILMAASRASLPGIAVIIVYALWRRRSKALFVVTAVCAAAALSVLGDTVIERLISPNMADMMSNFSRVEMLRTAFMILEENYYFFGVGMNNYSQIKFDHGFPLWYDARKVLSSHNFYMEVWLGWGILGLLGWLSFNTALVTRLLRRSRHSGTACAVVFAVISFALHGIFDSACANISVMFIYFSLTGVGLFVISRKDDAKDAPPNTNLSRRLEDERDSHAGDNQAGLAARR